MVSEITMAHVQLSSVLFSKYHQLPLRLINHRTNRIHPQAMSQSAIAAKTKNAHP
jgi:hypothetical protein